MVYLQETIWKSLMKRLSISICFCNYTSQFVFVIICIISLEITLEVKLEVWCECEAWAPWSSCYYPTLPSMVCFHLSYTSVTCSMCQALCRTLYNITLNHLQQPSKKVLLPESERWPLILLQTPLSNDVLRRGGVMDILDRKDDKQQRKRVTRNESSVACLHTTTPLLTCVVFRLTQKALFQELIVCFCVC